RPSKPAQVIDAVDPIAPPRAGESGGCPVRPAAVSVLCAAEALFHGSQRAVHLYPVTAGDPQREGRELRVRVVIQRGWLEYAPAAGPIAKSRPPPTARRRGRPPAILTP